MDFGASLSHAFAQLPHAYFVDCDVLVNEIICDGSTLRIEIRTHWAPHPQTARVSFYFTPLSAESLCMQCQGCNESFPYRPTNYSLETLRVARNFESVVTSALCRMMLLIEKARLQIPDSGF
jgi:hypothetical protein